MIAGLIIAIINSIGGSAIVIRRRYFQSQKLFDNKRMSGFPLKPRPIDSVLYILSILQQFSQTRIQFPKICPKIIIQSMLKIKGIEKDQSQSIDQSTDQEEKEIVTFVSHAPSSIQLSSSIDYDSLHKLYKTYNTDDDNDNDNHSDINMTDNININFQQKKKKVSLSSSLSSYTLYSPPSLPPPLHLYQTNSISTSFSDFSNKTLY
ncbi:hypothetical protein BJ944DRAFT_249575 [Cunninghamella echinulata]|nr:hypothetical protein BJ944DRAFT_249575 [Cunninghamella echinulata]